MAAAGASLPLSLVPLQVALALVLGGCVVSSTMEPTATTVSPAAVLAASSSGTRYEPTPEERRYTCRKLTGLVQVKLLQLAETGTRPRPSEAAMATRSVVGPLLGTANEVLDPASGWARERARVEAYNGLLGEKGCKTFDIPVELVRAARRDAAPPLPGRSPPR